MLTIEIGNANSIKFYVLLLLMLGIYIYIYIYMRAYLLKNTFTISHIMMLYYDKYDFVNLGII